MKNSLNIFLVFFFTISFFIFGWLSHSSYEPVDKKIKYSTLNQIKNEKELRVVLLNSPSTHYRGENGSQGFEYDLLKSYSNYLGVNLKVTTVNTVKEAIEKVADNNIHIVSASLTKTEERQKNFNFGPSYFEVKQQVICNRSMIKNKNFPRGLEDLNGLNIRVGEDTSYSETIRSLVHDGFDINVTFTSKYTTEELLEQVSLHRIDCTIADSNIYKLNLRYFPEMNMAFSVSEKEQLAWIFPRDSIPLSLDMYTWLNDFNQRGKMAELKDHYYGNIHYFDYYDNKVFYKRIKKRLPKYKKFFQKTAEEYSLPWKLIAAIAYQESHWNPNAKSFTGVRGMMMLTKATAKMLGIEDRVDVNQSINGGTRHIKKMIKLVPKDVEGENRLKFALAAYNVGMGHIHDAQILARRLGYNPNLWYDLKQVLPLLSKKKYYKTLKYGYARGEEPVKYVESIYAYRDILEKYKK